MKENLKFMMNVNPTAETNCSHIIFKQLAQDTFSAEWLKHIKSKEII